MRCLCIGRVPTWQPLHPRKHELPVQRAGRRNRHAASVGKLVSRELWLNPFDLPPTLYPALSPPLPAAWQPFLQSQRLALLQLSVPVSYNT